jgi:hypothetical protein
VSDHKCKLGMGVGASLAAGLESVLGLRIRNTYRFEARDREGRLKWVEEVDNLTVTQGLNDLLTNYFKGSAYTAAWYVGLINNASFTTLAAGDVAAQINGTNGWIEATAYTQGVRQTLALGSASAGSIDNTASKAVFTINGTVTINGAFLASSSTKTGTSGVLYGEASFGAARSLLSGDTLTVTVTLTAATA